MLDHGSFYSCLAWQKQLLGARGCFFCREFIACGRNGKLTANERRTNCESFVGIPFVTTNYFCGDKPIYADAEQESNPIKP